jgi:DNA-binding transcriptional LysR family regulator
MLNDIHLGNADLNLLPVFEAVLAERHVGKAALRLHLTPSAVSHGLNRLRFLLNDPLFLRTPKGVAPTARALELAEPIADILARVRRVVASAEPFDPARSGRRFTIGTPDGTVLLPPLLREIQRNAPGIDISMRTILRDTAIAELDARLADVVIVPLDEVPARFVHKMISEEDFVIVSRAGHPFAEAPTLDRYCTMKHIVVSTTGEWHTNVDNVLARDGRSRRIALTVPNFMLAFALIAETDLIAALPKSLLAMHGERFGLIGTPLPFRTRRFQVRAIVPKVAMMDAGVEWLFGILGRTD